MLNNVYHLGVIIILINLIIRRYTYNIRWEILPCVWDHPEIYYKFRIFASFDTFSWANIPKRWMVDTSNSQLLSGLWIVIIIVLHISNTLRLSISFLKTSSSHKKCFSSTGWFWSLWDLSHSLYDLQYFLFYWINRISPRGGKNMTKISFIKNMYSLYEKMCMCVYI